MKKPKELIKVVQAFKPGDIVFIETDQLLTQQQMLRTHEWFKSMVPELKIVILQKGMTVAGREIPAAKP